MEKRLRKKGQVLGGKKEKGYIQKAKEKSISKEREMDDYRCQMLEFKENSLKKRHNIGRKDIFNILQVKYLSQV